MGGGEAACLPAVEGAVAYSALHVIALSVIQKEFKSTSSSPTPLVGLYSSILFLISKRHGSSRYGWPSVGALVARREKELQCCGPVVSCDGL